MANQSDLQSVPQPDSRPVIPRAEAKARGLTRYYTGNPCKRGHVSSRIVTDASCAACKNEKRREWTKANPDRVREKNRARYEKSPEKMKAKDAAWYAANREKKIAYATARKALLTPEERKRIQPAANASGMRYYYRNHDVIIEKARAKREATRDERNAKARADYAASPSKRAANNAQRRAIKKRADTGAIETIKHFLVWMKSVSRLCCYWCGKNVPKAKRHMDHIIPLNRGGAHVIGNLCASCAFCNLSKNDKLPEVFAGQAELSFAA